MLIHFKNVYAFKLDISSLKIKRFNISKEWLLIIAYYRGWLGRYMNNPLIKKIKNEVERSDIIIAPIADNRKFEIISQFARAELTDLQCVYSLAAMNIGMQYVIRTNKAINNLSLIKSL